ncbi:hypothetical protein OAA90_00010 [Salibacteraceae bacterium]|nr:hypothetical protein [Salibacteraceae bacterium]
MTRKAFGFLLISALLFSIYSCSGDGASKTIKIGNEQWAVSRSLNYLGKIILEENGIPAEIVNIDIENIYRDLNKGKIDLFLDTWIAGHDVYLYEYNDVEDLGAVYKGCRLGMAVPSYFDIDSIVDLKRDSSIYGNVFYGISKDAGVMISSITALKQYEMNPRIVSMEEDKLVKQLELMTNQKQNFVTGAWKPHWKIKQYDLKFLADTSNSFIENDEIHKYAKAGFKKAYPKAAKILSNIFFTDDEFSDYLLVLKDATEPADIESKIRAWMKAHPEKVAAWVK